MAQTPDERVEALRQGTDGTILCLDLSHSEGQYAAEQLSRQSDEIAAALRSREGNIKYLLGMMPSNGPVFASLVEPPSLQSAITELWARSKEIGSSYAILIVPRSPIIVDIFMGLESLDNTEGTA